MARSSARHLAHPRDDQPLREQLEWINKRVERVREHPRFGIPRARALLNAQPRAGGQLVNPGPTKGPINHERVGRVRGR